MIKIINLRDKLREQNQNTLPAIVEKDGIGVVIVLKAASRSMITMGKIKRPKDKKDLPGELHVFVRDPVDRLKSAFQFFRDLQAKRKARFGGTGWDQIPRPANQNKEMTTWEDFVDHVLDGGKNQHWKPVSETISELDVPVTAHLFEDVDKDFPLGNLPKLNKSRRDDDIDLTYRADELQVLYTEDYNLRDSI